ncbi:MAG: GYD domain-containing protein [Candidatus Omnitrophica bacterium]|nr:GYD domain-containing protein [Candidatus Omnitrophota bacterium]
MAKFLMLGKYSLEAVKGIAPERTKKVVETIEKVGGKVHSMYALLGCHDLAIMVDFPSNSEAIKASLVITKLTGIGFSTSPAVSVEEFDKIAG